MIKISQLDDFMKSWNNDVPTDTSHIYDSHALINQLLEAFPIITNESLRFDALAVGDDTDWDALDDNHYYIFKSLEGHNAPDTSKMVTGNGIVFNFGISPNNTLVAMNSTCLAVRPNGQDWGYLAYTVKGSGTGTGGSDSGSSGGSADSAKNALYLQQSTWCPKGTPIGSFLVGASVGQGYSIVHDLNNDNYVYNYKIDNGNDIAFAFNRSDNSLIIYQTSNSKTQDPVTVSLTSIASISNQLSTINTTITAIESQVANAVNLNGDQKIYGKKTFSQTVMDATDGLPYITNKELQPLDSTSSTNDLTGSSSAWVRLPIGTYGLPDAVNPYMVRTINGDDNLIQLAFTEADPTVLYERVFPKGSNWSNWHNIGSPSDIAKLDQDANFTGKLQVNSKDVATTADVTNAVNAITSNSINWTSLSVDSSQIENSDWEPTTTNLQYRISHNTLYFSGQYIMLGNGTSSHNSNILYKLPTNIVSQISFPSTNKFAIGLLQAMAQQAAMFEVNLTNDGKITCVTNPHDLNTTYGATLASGFINAAIPLN